MRVIDGVDELAGIIVHGIGLSKSVRVRCVFSNLDSSI